jgi:CubicO group peptidase (beta-lactamase class C family)
MKKRLVIICLLSLICLPAICQQSQEQTSRIPTRLDESALLKQLKTELGNRCTEDLFSGIVLIAKNNKIIFENACGFANRELKIPNTLETQFNLGSMNKMFTSIAIAQLVSEGRLQYSDKLIKLLPDYPNREAAEKITVEYLLTHASGLGDVFTNEFMQNYKKIHDLKDYLPYFANQPLQFEPGTKRSYSNAGFILAGLIVEKVSGQNYFEYVRQNIYEKAGMNESSGFGGRKLNSSMAIGYTRERGKLEPNNFVLIAGSPAGGGYSTATDLLKFATALRDEKLIPADLFKKVIGLDRHSGSTYGYGFSREEVLSDLVVGHNGGAEGISADMDIYWNSGYVVISLANQDPRAAEEITKWIKERIKV